MMHWSENVVRSRGLVLAGALLLAALGLLAWKRLPLDAFPDVTNQQVMVLSEAPGLGPVDVEQQVSIPIETVMGGLPRVSLVRSLSKSGLSQVVVVFEDGVDTYLARQLVTERLQQARGDLPPGVEPELAADEAVAAADTLLLTIPNQLGVDYNVHVLDSVLRHLAPELGWR